MKPTYLYKHWARMLPTPSFFYENAFARLAHGRARAPLGPGDFAPPAPPSGRPWILFRQILNRTRVRWRKIYVKGPRAGPGPLGPRAPGILPPLPPPLDGPAREATMRSGLVLRLEGQADSEDKADAGRNVDTYTITNSKSSSTNTYSFTHEGVQL
ncbi:unnamed protein product [Nesidiocoris tenuis]|uniref:Uncharacterized protein n=1 Tax=Nesidiocoris tenuis TaxID=355587 RepID=A0A6H5GBX8_9HEMI|nr:unnamed protein product [Nesidiocoris tenuis]CAB0004328.1 unnamed protein product [Nesidiocoris tenuis]